MHETPDDMARLQALLDRSYRQAGSHLREIITPERRLDADALVGTLTGMCLLVVATVTSDGRPIAGPVDGVFHRGEFYFGPVSPHPGTAFGERRPCARGGAGGDRSRTGRADRRRLAGAG